MDERLSKALEFSNYSVTINNQKRILKEQFVDGCLYFIQGSRFLITKELINYVAFLVDRGNTSDIVLIDDNDIPVMIEDLEKFLDDILDQYFLVANEYHENYIQLSKRRSIEKLINE